MIDTARQLTAPATIRIAVHTSGQNKPLGMPFRGREAVTAPELEAATAPELGVELDAEAGGVDVIAARPSS
ncbi:hypothetical protein [cf. Phormidesmis sp. LEGE 11477]|uniref:hypothetical protein n=1 Tax=cf. Phormidesmis sp. LEGE 11477 TaxID=1828680 RepID=UPI001882DD9F|nr:hypothetical protein [cf. Phormidesmis sp. LEGE 11477]MBE9064318.1 hypothetical protein [cf. Phormidesmis sp. LEGE 11477]